MTGIGTPSLTCPRRCAIMPVLVRLVHVMSGGLPMHASEEDPEAAARVGAAPFRLAFDQAPIGLALVGLDGRVRRVNRALCVALGYDAHELRSRAFVDLIGPDDVARAVACAERLVRGEISWD